MSATALHLAMRREPLRAARTLNPMRDVQNSIAEVKTQQQIAEMSIIHARKVLVREATAVFGIHHRAYWEIAGLPLPPPESFRRESLTLQS